MMSYRINSEPGLKLKLMCSVILWCGCLLFNFVEVKLASHKDVCRLLIDGARIFTFDFGSLGIYSPARACAKRIGQANTWFRKVL